MYMHSRCGPVFIRTSGGKCRDRLVNCCCLLLVLQVRSEEVGTAALRGGRSLARLLRVGGGGSLSKVLRLYCELSVSV